MSDLTCRCVPVQYQSVARLVEAARNDTRSIASRVTDLEEQMEALEARVTELESTSESPFVVVDTEDELDAAILVGKHILLRGEGNEGVIEITTQKDVNVRGTQIHGYGMDNGTGHFGKIKCNFPVAKIYGDPFPHVAFYIHTDDVTIGGFDLEGRNANDLVTASYTVFLLDPFVEQRGIRIHDMRMWNIRNALVKQGFEGASPTRRVVFENNEVYSATHYVVSLRESVYDSVIRGNRITPRLDGDPDVFVNAQGLYLASGINDCVVEHNIIRNPSRMGMEFTSVAYDVGEFMPMARNKILNNTVLNAGSMGISATYGDGYHIIDNTVDEAGSIGIESSNGSTLGESNGVCRTIIRGNAIRGITSPTYATGIACDQSVGDIVEGNRIENVSSDFTGSGAWAYARGVMVYRALRAQIRGNFFEHVNGTGVFVQPAGLTGTTLQAVIEGNTFRVTADDTRALNAVVSQGSSCVVRHNVAYEPAAGPSTNRFETQFTSPAVIKAGFAWSADITADGLYLESNLVIQE